MMFNFRQVAAATSRRGWPLALLLVAVTILLLAPLPIGPAKQHWPALVNELENLGHPLMFGLLAHSAFLLLRAYWQAPARAPYLVVLVGAAGFGLATEAVQRLVGRDSSWLDLVNDVLGAGCVLALHARRDYRLGARAGCAAWVLGLLATGPFLWTMAAYGARTAKAPVLWRPDALLLQRFAYWQGDNYPGLVIDEPLMDWSGYRMLAIELRNLRGAVSPVAVRVHDRQHNQAYEDRFNRTFELPAGGTATWRIALEDIRLAPRGRQMDMTAIRGVIMFQTAGGVAPFFEVREVRLER